MDEQSTTTPDNAASLLGNLLNNPALLTEIGSMLSAPTETTTSATPPPDGLSKVLSDPALMAKLPQVMAMLQPMLAGNGTRPQACEEDKAVPTCEATPAISQPPHRNCRDDLLLALKPFLSPARCEAVDTIIRLSKLGAVLKHLQ